MKKYIEVIKYDNSPYLYIRDTSFGITLALNLEDVKYLIQKLNEFGLLNLEKNNE